MQLLLASNNTHKQRELAEIMQRHELITPAQLGLEFEHDETADSFIGNAHDKARALYELVTEHREAAAAGGASKRAAAGSHPKASDAAGGGPDAPAASGALVIVADDSGLCVDALGGEPGVRSARYGSAPGGPDLNDAERNQLLLSALAHTNDRDAHYVCCMVAYLGADRFYIVQETWHGRIATQPSTGKGGFGYDPVFFLPDLGVTVADISAAEKHRCSHRGKAARRLALLLDALEHEIN